jgi:capsular polysaccharide transport system ATP-binding protein
MIRLQNVTKYFKTEGEKKYILKDVSFTLPEGVNLGILGRNGAGKSTFLRMLGGIDFPSSGTITSDKSFSWPMGLAGGFQGSMTGRQNVKFVCRIYGKNEEEITSIISYVQEFAEIGEYFDMPIKLYSSGMKSRLSFGLSLAFEFDYLIIDETLSVGDENFKKKATAALKKKIESCNVLLVSHSMGTLKEICDVGVVLHEGVLHYFNKIEDAIGYYHTINMQTSVQKNNVVQSSAVYCDDGRVFDDINAAAIFYKMRPFSIIQALEKNNGSHMFLKKVFYKDGHPKPLFQKWQHFDDATIIGSDGVIFENAEEATSFYRERFINKKIDEDHIANVLLTEEKFSALLSVKFYYLSEFQ